jgi:2-C-methyl-D-erythritol 4-phosphate cytidylyltransferase
MNTGIILAAGNSARFNQKISKQLYKINNKTILSYSVAALKDLNEIIIVTNSKCFRAIEDEIARFNAKNIALVINDKDDRIDSIKTALENTNAHTKNIIIHDAARPYIKRAHIKTLLKSSKTYAYSQYILRLTNGLIKKTGTSIECLDRDQYMELCTPIISNYNLYKFIVDTYIGKGSHEVLSLVDSFKIPYNLIEGSHKDLRKITTISDVY